MRITRVFAALLVLHLAHAFVAQSASAQPAKRLITETDLFRFVWVADPRPSPDGTRVAFTRVTVNEKGEGYDTALWIVPADGSAPPARLTAGTRDSQPRWSPDGKRIAFLRAPMRDGKPEPPQIHLLSITGGEAWRLTDVPRGTSAAVWSPDGKRIAFTSGANAKDLEKQRREKAARKTAQDVDVPRAVETAAKPPATTPDENDRESDVRTITRAVYRFDNQGYIDSEHRSHIWVADVPAIADEPVAAKQLTDGKYEEDDPIWSHDSVRIYYTSTRIDEPYYELPQSDIFAVPANGGESEKIAALEFEIGQASLSPDGRTLAFVAEVSKPIRSFSQPDLWVLDLARGATPKNLTTDFDFDVGGGIGGDQRAPRGNAGSRVLWSDDAKSIVAVVGREGRANLMRFPVAGGAPSNVTSGDQTVMSYSASRSGALALIISTPTVLGDLSILDTPNAKPRRVTSFNDALFAQLSLTQPEEIWYTSFDGKRVHAWAQRPPDFDPSKKYPMILNIHGGPHSAWGFIFTHEFQWMAARGYIVLYPNPRGSSTYGQEFGNIIQYRYPGDDHKDLMAGVDEVIKRGWADPKLLGVTGGSGGGLLTNWAVTQTDRFRAAVSQRDIADWSAWWYTADFTLFQANWFRKAPFEDPTDFAQRSPITHVEKIKTPLMFILGEADYRTPAASGGESLFRALKYLRRPTAIVRFPNESHELSRSGQPWHRVERLRSIVGWMDKYILGKDVEQFRDVAGQDVGVPPE
ncbi:MAG TPA: S9 family peptidase [Thermoanaerobaculia bacterium]|jgi:dipeptidyl aminopeptidase/acylaminoacyl peptidase|nr:S9 family peptidase [Thermoanaerobaculia bacterium]